MRERAQMLQESKVKFCSKQNKQSTYALLNSDSEQLAILFKTTKNVRYFKQVQVCKLQDVLQYFELDLQKEFEKLVTSRYLDIDLGHRGKSLLGMEVERYI